jgi:biopolymer transport protein TolR
MAMSVGGKRGVTADPNVVPLIDILLVLLVIFMIIPVHNMGLDAKLPQPSPDVGPSSPEGIIVVQVLADGSLRINQDSVSWDDFSHRMAEIFKQRASRVAFIRGEGPVEFGVVAKAIDGMRDAGIVSVGLLTPKLEKSL